MIKALRCLLGLALVWLGSWLSLGLLWGQPTLLLHPLRAPEGLRVAYLVLLYVGVLSWLTWLWRAYPPDLGGTGLARGRGRDFFRGWWLGALGLLLQRLCLGSAWQPLWPSGEAWASALLLAPGLALVEELVFRGYLYGVWAQEYGPSRAAIWVSGLFALVHLFRPGTLPFKVAFAVGLVLASLVLVQVCRRWGLLAAVGTHSAWISGNILDPPGRVQPGWWSGLSGEPSAGVCAMVLMVMMGWSLSLGMKSGKKECPG